MMSCFYARFIRNYSAFVMQRGTDKIYFKNIKKAVAVKNASKDINVINGYKDKLGKMDELSQLILTSNPSDIMRILDDNKRNINSNVLNNAMKRCNDVNKYYVTDIIFKNALKDNRECIDSSVFSVYFYGMGKWFQMKKCQEMYEILIKLDIKPDINVFDSLLNGCVLQGYKVEIYSYAQELWYQMIEIYGIKPNINIIISMLKIYSMQKDIDKSKELFYNYVINSNDKWIQNNDKIWHSYLKVFSNQGLISDMKEGLKLMKQYKDELKFNNSLYSIIMSCYSNGNKPNKVIQYFNSMINSNINPNFMNLFLKYLAYYSLQIKYDNINSNVYHSKIINDMDNEFNQYNLEYNYKCDTLKLESYIQYYSNINPHKMVEFFESNINKYPIYIKPNMIDLHGYSFLNIQFILRYIFAYELHILKHYKTFHIICGIAKSQNSIQNFIKNEILIWNTELFLVSDPNDDAILIIRNISCIQNISPTMRFFKEPSIDWKF